MEGIACVCMWCGRGDDLVEGWLALGKPIIPSHTHGINVQ